MRQFHFNLAHQKQTKSPPWIQQFNCYNHFDSKWTEGNNSICNQFEQLLYGSWWACYCYGVMIMVITATITTGPIKMWFILKDTRLSQIVPPSITAEWRFCFFCYYVSSSAGQTNATEPIWYCMTSQHINNGAVGPCFTQVKHKACVSESKETTIVNSRLNSHLLQIESIPPRVDFSVCARLRGPSPKTHVLDVK